MLDAYLKLSPIIIIFVIGLLLRRTGILQAQARDLLLKLVFYVSAPALILSSVSTVQLKPELVLFPFIPVIIMVIMWPVSTVIGRALRLPSNRLGVFVTGTLIMNIGFLIPFTLLLFGAEGIARSSLFDIGNGLLTFTLVYGLAVRYGSQDGQKFMIKKFLISPPLWSLIIALAINIFKVPLPSVLTSTTSMLGGMTGPLILLALGASFTLRLVQPRAALIGLILRSGGGLLLGLLIVNILHLEGLDRSFILLASAAPIGYNSLTFASLEKLDEEFAASMISLSVLLGMILIPILSGLHLLNT